MRFWGNRARAGIVIWAGVCGCGTPPPEPLPQGPLGQILAVEESRGFDLTGLEANAYVLRTEGSIPHIYAETERDLRLVQGFILARDRFFQIDLIRRYGLGTLSELVGEPVLGTDITSRVRGVPDVARRVCSQLSEQERSTLEATASGINQYIDAVRAGTLPPPSEYASTRVLLAPNARSVADMMVPFDVDDLCGLAGSISTGLGWEEEDLILSRSDAEAIANTAGAPFAELRREGARQDVLARADSADTYVSVPDVTATNTGRASRQRGRRALNRRPSNPRGLAQLEAVLAQLDVHPTLRHNREELGSNVWAVRRPEGGSIVAGDWHLPITIPALLFQVGLDARTLGQDPAATRQLGVVFPGLPWLAVGTNGNIAWSNTYPELDVTDWYREEVIVDASGRPTATRFQNEDRPLAAPVVEAFTIANVPVLNSVGRTESWERFVTFDGRHLTWIEGTEYEPGSAPDGAALVNLDGRQVHPEDTDQDGVISAYSYDYASFDATDIMGLLRSLSESESVDTFRQALNTNLGFTQNMVVGDQNGGIYYTNYSALPCRRHLRPEGQNTGWREGADPHRVIDGTRYGAFEIPIANGRPDESATTDAQRCVIPRAQYPEALNPAQRYLISANNDPIGLSVDGDLSNDALYLGGNWAPGYRARQIAEGIQNALSTGTVSIESMEALQNSHRSNIARDMSTYLTGAVSRARALVDAQNRTDAEDRLVALYQSQSARLDEVASRITDWVTRGAIARSGVVTFYDLDAASHRDDAVATMVFNQWYRQLHEGIWNDENLPNLFDESSVERFVNVMIRLLDGIGPNNPQSLASYHEPIQASIFFDVLNTPEIETPDETILSAGLQMLAALEAPETSPGVGGFGTTDMNQWLWGMRHLVRFESILVSFGAIDAPSISSLLNGFSIRPSRLPLAADLPETDPRDALPWYPRNGDNGNIDASSWRPENPNFWNGYGSSMRMVVELSPDGTVRGQNVVPGGQSGLTNSEHFSDQAALWLAGETMPMRFSLDDVVQGATARETFRPRRIDR